MQIHNNTHSTPSNTHLTVAIIGAGPAGLMAAEVISAAGFKVHVYDSKASAARKFLLAGVGGMNITHAEDWPLFISRYGEQQQQLQPILQAFTPQFTPLDSCVRY
jgi:predicted flavoprotein YhiN